MPVLFAADILSAKVIFLFSIDVSAALGAKAKKASKAVRRNREKIIGLI